MVQSVCGGFGEPRDVIENGSGDAAMDQFNEVLHFAAKIEHRYLREIAAFKSPPADVIAICQIIHCLKTNERFERIGWNEIKKGPCFSANFAEIDMDNLSQN